MANAIYHEEACLVLPMLRRTATEQPEEVQHRLKVHRPFVRSRKPNKRFPEVETLLPWYVMEQWLQCVTSEGMPKHESNGTKGTHYRDTNHHQQQVDCHSKKQKNLPLNQQTLSLATEGT